MTNGASHCVVAIAHGQKWAVGNAAIIKEYSANKPLSGCQWYQKGPFGVRIARELHQAIRTLLTCWPGTRAGVDQQEVGPTIDGSGAIIEDDGAGNGQQERVEGYGLDK
jgi:hypothetical protein